MAYSLTSPVSESWGGGQIPRVSASLVSWAPRDGLHVGGDFESLPRTGGMGLGKVTAVMRAGQF